MPQGAAMVRLIGMAAAAGGMAVAVAVLGWTLGPDTDEPGHFEISATHDDGMIHISFRDDSGGTETVAMEILGMAETFRRTYESDSFEETVRFPGPPRYGWGAHPVIFEVTHGTLGEMRIKTEIRDIGQPPADVIFERR